MARQKPRSRRNRVITWVASLAFTVWIFTALISSTDEVGGVVVRTDMDEDDRALAEKTFRGKIGIHGVIRVAPELVDSAPKTGKVYVRLVNAALASGNTLAIKAFPAVADGPMLFHFGPEDMKSPNAFSQEIDVSAHWSQGDNPTMDVNGDLKGKCARNPLKPGEQIAVVVLGVLVGSTSQPASPY